MRKLFAYKPLFVFAAILLVYGNCHAQFRPRKTAEDEKKIPEIVNFGGFEFGSTKRGYITRELGMSSAMDPKKHESGWYDKFYDHEVIVGGDYNDEGLLYKVYFSPNCVTWCATNEEFHKEIHKVIDKLEEYNGGPLYGWPMTPFVNVVPPAELQTQDIRLKDLWDIVQGEFCKHGLRNFTMHSISDSGIMLRLSVTIPRERQYVTASYWTVVMIKPGLFPWGHNNFGSFYKGHGKRRLKDPDEPIVADQRIIGVANPTAMKIPPEDDFLWRHDYKRGEKFINALKIKLNERDRQKRRWQAPKEITVNGEVYLLDFNGERGRLIEKDSGRRLQILITVRETAKEADSIRSVFLRWATSSMIDEAIISGNEVRYNQDMIIIKGSRWSYAILKNLVVEVEAESDSDIFAETILEKGLLKQSMIERIIESL